MITLLGWGGASGAPLLTSVLGAAALTSAEPFPLSCGIAPSHNEPYEEPHDVGSGVGVSGVGVILLHLRYASGVGLAACTGFRCGTDSSSENVTLFFSGGKKDLPPVVDSGC